MGTAKQDTDNALRAFLRYKTTHKHDRINLRTTLQLQLSQLIFFSFFFYPRVATEGQCVET